ncbi:hypothetical protein TNCV_4589181 [Trichonephila clavipes]|nr:hypothetical protein TNCV_4589181 [Trichonephila clavipes]
MPHSSRSASCKDIEVCVALQRNAGPNHRASAIVMVNFSGIGGQVVGLYPLRMKVRREYIDWSPIRHSAGWVAWLVCRKPSAPKVAGSTSAQVGGLS